MNFNSQTCTSREQSERLLALGLSKKTADMAIEQDIESVYSAYYISAYPPSMRGIPAWSLHRLLMMTTSKRKVMLIRCESDLFDVVIKRIEHEIKEGYFPKEYLEE